MKLGFIVFGEAAHNIASGLKQEGWNDILAFDKFRDVEPRCDLIRKRAGETDVTLMANRQRD